MPNIQLKKELSIYKREDHTKVQNLSHNHRSNNTSRMYPELVKPQKISEPEATYYAALELVARIDEDLTQGIRHYRNKGGVLLTTLDEVVRAILDDNLLTEELEPEMVWMTPQELAA
jgi:hypothetical protein